MEKMFDLDIQVKPTSTTAGVASTWTNYPEVGTILCTLTC
ncbi:lantibiotic paenibacillin [Tumebacillus permanentifrigoris]|uniref:Uncharacterized protein n=1 Tax=Tumebacillus permanentifrigoris TaxID=378543 RepID=A0A316DD08_9BACL|nr:lantibiotic paenibacillin [Tumebacillus permanentifrigoris]PWK15013.1 hypothetical protein C7459_104219 [Tumebacillus permanentifrigoris]